MKLVEDTLRIGGVELALLRPPEPEVLLDEERFADDEFMPYWAELWPSGLALARALPDRLEGLVVVELGCGLGVPSLVAAARGAHVTAVDWAPEAIELLRENAACNQVRVDAVHADWRTFAGSFDVVLAADLLYEARNAEALLDLLPDLGPQVLLAEPGRPHAAAFFQSAGKTWKIAELGDRIYELTRATRAARPARGGG